MNVTGCWTPAEEVKEGETHAEAERRATVNRCLHRNEVPDWMSIVRITRAAFRNRTVRPARLPFVRTHILSRYLPRSDGDEPDPGKPEDRTAPDPHRTRRQRSPVVFKLADPSLPLAFFRSGTRLTVQREPVFDAVKRVEPQSETVAKHRWCPVMPYQIARWRQPSAVWKTDPLARSPGRLPLQTDHGAQRLIKQVYLIMPRPTRKEQAWGLLHGRSP